ncbi:hypothetical protein MIR68_011948 [Amoeboaphelidium protococcarum]|nr:hypothetical protein MIR68_011948 [Amoeboaphelidium protococcarum]
MKVLFLILVVFVLFQAAVLAIPTAPKGGDLDKGKGGQKTGAGPGCGNNGKCEGKKDGDDKGPKDGDGKGKRGRRCKRSVGGQCGGHKRKQGDKDGKDGKEQWKEKQPNRTQ